jgi:membrane-associated phospholipid phosphatase
MEHQELSSPSAQARHLVIRWLIGLGLVLVLVLIFGEMAEEVWFREGFAWDAPIILSIHRLSNPILDAVMWLVTQTGEIGAVLVVLVAAIWFVRHKRNVDALAIVISLGGAAALNAVMKLIFARPRPSLFPPMVAVSGFSFPSGHVTAAVAVYGFLAVLLWRSGRRGWAILSAFWVVVVAISRIYLGAHYPSDTLGAMVSTSLWLLVVFFIRDRQMRSVGSNPDSDQG